MNPSLCHEVLRLQSFKDARLENTANVSVILLAEEGFYFDHNTRRILCFGCGFECIPRDSSTSHHILHAANCQRHDLNKSVRKWTSGLTSYVAGQDQQTCRQQNSDPDFPSASNTQEHFPSNNGTIHNSINGHSNQLLSKSKQQRNTTSTQDPQNRDRSTQPPSTAAPQTVAFSQAETVTERERASDHSTLNISSVSYPHFSSRQTRIATFTSWNPAHSHRADDFADLGFFFTGNTDCVRCFCCGLGLKSWRPTDDIAYQHAHLRPACAFIRLCKGQDYIDRVQQESRAHQREPNIDQLRISETTSRPPLSTSTDTSLPHANERLSNSPSNGQPSPATTTNGQTSSAVTTKGQTNPAVTTNSQTSPSVTTNRQIGPSVRTDRQIGPSVTTDRQIGPSVTTDKQICPSVTTERQTSPAAATDKQTSPAVTTDRQTSPSITTNRQTSPAVTSNGKFSSAVTTNIQTNQPVITNAMACSGASAKGGLASLSISAHQRISRLGISHSTASSDSGYSDDSSVGETPCASAATTLEATNGNLTDNQISRKEELRVVEREHSLLSERIKCRICQVATVSSIYLPCGHVASCQECADEATRCVLCGKVIIGTANIYLS